MKFGSFEVFNKKNKETNIDVSIEKSGDSELAPNKEIYGLLSDPEFIKTFPGPSDFQYQILRNNLVSFKQDTINSMAYLKDFVKNSDNPLFSLIRFSQFLHTAIGNQKNFSHDKKQKEISNILEKGFNEISSDKHVKYFLSVMLKPSIVLSPTQSFESQERGLTPVQISKEYFVQDNGFDPIPIFYHTEKPEDFISLIEEQKRFFENARPENRQEITKNPSLKEMKEYHDKFIKPTIYFNDIKKDFKEKIINSTHKLTPDEIQNFFPESKNIYELTQDPRMFEFRAFANQKIRSFLEKEFDVDFKEIPLKEQIYFLTSISNRTNETIKPVQEFTKKFKAIGLRTFLSIEQGGESMGDKILALGEKLPEEVARKVFAKYGEYIDAVDSVEEMIKKEYKLSPSPELIAKTKESLLIRGRDLLLSQNKKLSDGIFSDEKFTQELEKIKVDVDLFKTIFKITKENNPDTVLEDFIGLKPEKINNTSLINNEDILEIKEIITENYASDKELGEYAFDSFKKAIQNNDLTEVNFLRKYKKIIALNRLDIKKDGSLYFGSFNVDPKYCNSKIGDAFFQATIAPKLKEKVVSADCPINQPISAYYIESGFVGNNLHIVGKTSLMAIVSNPKQSYESKKLSKESIIKLSNKAESAINIYFAKSQEELPFSDVNQGKILTRYFFDKNTKLWYVAFE